MKYAIVDILKDGTWWIDKFESKEEALEKAEREWNGFSKHDKDRRDEYTVVSFENEENFDDSYEINEVVKIYK